MGAFHRCWGLLFVPLIVCAAYRLCRLSFVPLVAVPVRMREQGPGLLEPSFGGVVTRPVFRGRRHDMAVMPWKHILLRLPGFGPDQSIAGTWLILVHIPVHRRSGRQQARQNRRR